MPDSKSFQALVRELEKKYGVEIKEAEPQPGIREMRKVYRPTRRPSVGTVASRD